MTTACATDPNSETKAFLDFWFSITPPGHLLEVRPLNKKRGQRPVGQAFTPDADAALAHVTKCVANGDDVYVGALPRRTPGGKEKNVGALCWLWSDIDYGQVGHASPAPYATADDAKRSIETLGITPSLVVDTGGGYHVWYALESEPSQADWRDAIERLCFALNGDSNALDLPRILRVPGTFNHKADPPRPARIVTIDPNTRHSIATFLALPAVPDDVPDPNQQTIPHQQSGTVPSNDRPFDRANAIPIADVLDFLGIKMHREGPRTYCACPVHHGHNTSQMVVGGDENKAYCFGDCEKSYSPVDIVAAVHRCDPKQAVNEIANRFNFDGFTKRGPGRPAQVIQHPSANRPRPPADAPAAPAQPLLPDPTAANPNWRSTLDQNAKGLPRNTLGNLIKILRNHSAYAGRLSYDQMRISPMLDGKVTTDNFDTTVRLVAEQELGTAPSTENTRQAIAVVAAENTYHPVRRYLESLTWDGHHRIARVAPDILKSPQPISTTMVSKWFISAVARAMTPGCKVDTALILVGDQGALKSTFFAILGGEWFSDSRMDISRPDSYLQLHAAWIYEWAELENVTSRKDAAEVKSFITSTCDTFRAPYGRTVQQHPRTTVIVGTTNLEQFLTDRTGARRFHIVRVPPGWRLDVQALTDWRDQLWAEALHLYRAGTAHWLDNPDDERAQREVAEEHETDDSWAAPLATWLAMPEAKSEPITMSRLLTKALSIEPRFQTESVERRVGALMRRMGWHNTRQRNSDGARPRVWTPLS